MKRIGSLTSCEGAQNSTVIELGAYSLLGRGVHYESTYEHLSTKNGLLT